MASGFGFRIFGVTPSNIINAAIFKLAKMSKNFHGRFTAKNAKFLSSHLIERIVH